MPRTVKIGSGSSTLALFVSERAESAGAEFIIDVNGIEIDGIQTTTADSTAGALQEFDVLDTIPSGINTVSIAYLNASDSVLNIMSATINGTPVPNSAISLSNDGAATFSFLATGTLTPVVIGSGPDTLALTMAERAEPAGAQFTVSVDGIQIGGVQTTAADLTWGESQTFDMEGSFAPGSNTVSIKYLNASNSVLTVQNATINGTAVPNSAIALSNNGSVGFSFTGPAVDAPVTIGVGTDTLMLSVSERGQPTGAQFTIDVDGMQVGGVQTTTADSTAGLAQTFNVLGNFPAGSNTVSINYLNASNSLLFVNSARIDDTMVAGSALTLSNIGSGGFTFMAPAPAPTGTTVIGSGPDTLALTLAQRGQPSGALFTIDVDGTQIDGVQSVTANTRTGQTQELDVTGDFGSGPHTVSIDYLNASNSVLSITGATIDGSAIPAGEITINNIGSVAFAFILAAGKTLAAPTLDLQSTATSGEIVDLATDQMATPITILPLGDSITAGWTQRDTLDPSNLPTEPGYRGPLWLEFVLNSTFVNLVGPNSNGPASLPDTANAGYPGYTTAQLLGLLPAILAQGVVQDVFLLAGANDLAQGVPEATTIANLTTIIDTIESAHPATNVFLSQLPPLVRYSVTSLNDAISSLVSRLSAEGKKVSLVSQSNLTTADVGDDGVHPTPAGYALIAQNWYGAILAAQPNIGGTPAGVVSTIPTNTVDILGGPGPEYLIGNLQNNTITAGSGNDLLSGGGGTDTLIGGVGADQYLIGDVSGQVTIRNFSQSKGDYLDWSGIPGLTDATRLAEVTKQSNGQTVVNLLPFGLNQQVILSNYTGTLANSLFLDTPTLTPVVIGSGPDTLALTMAERAEPAGAQFTVSVDGIQIGGVQTTAADLTWGESQTFDMEGSFAPGSNTVSIKYLNASNSVLTVQNATINGTAVPNSAIALSNNGSVGFSFTGPAVDAPVTIGVGADTLMLSVSERGQPTGAQFTIDVDGMQVGGVQTTTADSTAGLAQTFNVLGNFPAGSNTVSINYLNASNSLLFVNSARIDDTMVAGSALTLSNIGSGGFTFMAPAPAPTGTTVIGSGPDTLALTLAQRGQPSGALFTIDVDGTQIDGVQSVTAKTRTGQTQELDVTGNFGSGPHTVSIDYLNASNSVLSITGATIDGSAIPAGTAVLNTVGTFSFVFLASPGHN